MLGTDTRPKVVLYSPYQWEHVCPLIRVVRPCAEAGLGVVPGDEWDDNSVRPGPERLSEADVVVVQRTFPDRVVEFDRVVTLARAQNKPIVYELDDLLWALPQEHVDHYFYSGTRMAMLFALAQADAVTCSTEPLAANLREFHSNVTVLPNYLDERLWATALARPAAGSGGQPDSERPLVIGYMGSQGHLSDLESIQSVLLALLQHYGPAVRLRFWGVQPPLGLAGHPLVDCLMPDLVSYIEFAGYFGRQECDIFIAPLRDSLFNHCKSSLKFLEYAALGVPGVYSRVEPYQVVVTDGVSGMLAGTAEEWFSTLCALIDKPDLRSTIGHNARQQVLDHWLLSRNAGSWAEFYQRVKPRLVTERQQLLSFTRQARAWYAEQRAHLDTTTAQLEAVSAQFGATQRELDSVQAQFEAVIHSPGWQAVEKVGAARRRIIPPNSRRERIAALGTRAVARWKQQGLRSVVRNARRGEEDRQD